MIFLCVRMQTEEENINNKKQQEISFVEGNLLDAVVSLSVKCLTCLILYVKQHHHHPISLSPSSCRFTYNTGFPHSICCCFHFFFFFYSRFYTDFTYIK